MGIDNDIAGVKFCDKTDQKKSLDLPSQSVY